MCLFSIELPILFSLYPSCDVCVCVQCDDFHSNDEVKFNVHEYKSFISCVVKVMPAIFVITSKQMVYRFAPFTIQATMTRMRRIFFKNSSLFHYFEWKYLIATAIVWTESVGSKKQLFRPMSTAISYQERWKVYCVDNGAITLECSLYFTLLIWLWHLQWSMPFEWRIWIKFRMTWNRCIRMRKIVLCSEITWPRTGMFLFFLYLDWDFKDIVWCCANVRIYIYCGRYNIGSSINGS